MTGRLKRRDRHRLRVTLNQRDMGDAGSMLLGLNAAILILLFSEAKDV